MKPQSEGLLERLVFDLGVAIAEAESTRVPDNEYRSRLSVLCKKWRGQIEALTMAADSAVETAAKTLALQEDNAALRKELDALKTENDGLKAEQAELQNKLAEKQTKKAPPEKPAEPEKEKSEFGEAMKGVKRY